jgi:hypothetical protein
MWTFFERRGHRFDDNGAGNDVPTATSSDDDDDVATGSSGCGSAGHPRTTRMDEGG